jgi:hypothetical protein
MIIICESNHYGCIADHNYIGSMIKTFILSQTGSPFLDVLVYRNGTALSTEVYRTPTQIGRYLHFKSSDPTRVKEESGPQFDQ